MDIIITFFLSSLALILNLLQLKYNGTNMFQQHPTIAGIAVISLIIYCIMLWMELKYAVYYENYLGSHSFIVNLMGCLSMVSTISLLLPTYVTPFVFIVGLIIPITKALHWIFTKIDEHFGDTEFWRRSIDPTLCYMRRKMNISRRNLLPF